MTEEQKIDELNKKIIINQKKIRNINIYESALSLGLSGAIILGGVTLIIKNYDNPTVIKLSPTILVSTLALSCGPIIYIPSRKNMMKKTEYMQEIKESLNELHTYALEEDKKIMNKKR